MSSKISKYQVWRYDWNAAVNGWSFIQGFIDRDEAVMLYCELVIRYGEKSVFLGEDVSPQIEAKEVK